MCRLVPTTILCVLLLCASQGLAGEAPIRNLSRIHIPNQLIVKFRDGVQSKTRALDLAVLGGITIERFRASGAVLVDFPKLKGKNALADVALKLAKMPNVQYVEANSVIRAINLPNDPKLAELYGLNNTGQTNGTADADIDAPEAWATTTGSKSVVVAVIDTGVNYEHHDLKDNYWTNPGESGVDVNGNDKRSNGVDDDGNGYVDDWRGWDFVNSDNDPMDDNSHMHGTHCAGTIGAKGNDGFGVVGVNWQVSIVGIKFLSASGSGTTADAIKAIEYANTLGVAIQSNSWGGGGYSEAMAAAIAEAESLGILFVAAAGNSAADNDTMPHYPSSYDSDNVLAVAATDHADALASFSCYGLESVDMAAPGVDIVSTSSGQDFRTLSGTSMATPHVSGAAALIKARFPALSAAELKQRLMYGADPIASLDGKMRTGGRLNAARSLETDDVPPNKITAIAFSNTSYNSTELNWPFSGDDGMMSGRAAAYEVRYAANPIVSEVSWNKAKTAALVMAGSADVIRAKISNLPFNYQGHVSVRAYDNVGNISPIGITKSFAVQPVQPIFAHNADATTGTSRHAPWDVEVLEDGRKVFSDSPGADYENEQDVAITLDPIKVDTDQVLLAIDTWYEVEYNYDFAFVEVSTDGSKWDEVAKWTGTADWQSRVIDLAGKIKANKDFQIRFRLKTDYVITDSGWMIDNIRLLKATPKIARR